METLLVAPDLPQGIPIIALSAEAIHDTQQAARLAEDDPQRLLQHRLQVDVLDKLRRIYGVAEHMAVTMLPRGALAGELSP